MQPLATTTLREVHVTIYAHKSDTLLQRVTIEPTRPRLPGALKGYRFRAASAR